MNTDERKKVTEAWIEAAKITGHHIMVHIGSTNLNNVIKLVRNNYIVSFYHNELKEIA